MRYFILILMVAMVSCNDHGEGTHDHSTEVHEHDGEKTEEVVSPVTITIWTNNVEFFVEFPVLVVDNPSRFAAHFTLLDKHQPLEEGNLSIKLVDKDGTVITTEAEPSSPGFFSPEITPQAAGTYDLVFELISGELAEEIILMDVPVYQDEHQALENQVEQTERGNTIEFLKEQAWNIDFQTKQAVSEEIYDVVYSSGVWKTAPGATKSIVAPVSGVVDFKSGRMTDGGVVNKGQHLLSISSNQLTSNNIGVNVEQARSLFEQAEAEYNRKLELYEARIIPRAEFEEVESRYQIARSEFESLARGYSSGSKVVRAPFSGYIKSVDVQNGDFVSEGEKIITIATDRSKILESHVSPAYAVSAEDVRNVWYQPRPGVWSSLNDAGGTLLSVSEQVSADHPMAAVFAQVNEEVKMPAGGFSEVQIALGPFHKGIVVPEDALLEDYGNFSVIVQLSGEQFERRPIKTGRRNGEMVEVTMGLKEGEWVVTTGAYQVKMASMSSEIPGHGHEH